MLRASLLFAALLALLTSAAVSPAATHNVVITNFAFSPSSLMISVGDTVTWTNNDFYPHTVTALAGEFDSGNLPVGQSFSHVFATAGDFAYHCEYHSSMTGSVQAMAMALPHLIAITNFAFDPSDLTIDVGDSVRWTNMDGVSHTVSADDGSFDSGVLSSGQSFTFVFSTEGNFSYACQIHTHMTGVIHVGTANGASDPGATLPQAVELMANYPNPFNPSTTIEFSVHSAGHVSLDVFDVLGQRVATLTNGPLNAGVYRTEFNGSTLPSGIYFYQLRAANQVLSRRMMLVK